MSIQSTLESSEALVREWYPIHLEASEALVREWYSIQRALVKAEDEAIFLAKMEQITDDAYKTANPDEYIELNFQALKANIVAEHAKKQIEFQTNLAELEAKLEAGKANLDNILVEQKAFETKCKIANAELLAQISRADDDLVAECKVIEDKGLDTKEARDALRTFRLDIFVARHTGSTRAYAKIAAEDAAAHATLVTPVEFD
jgi:hypothetical protein